MSNVQVSNEAIAPNAKRLLFAGFMAILAAGVGFGIRGGILANWGADFGFTAQQLGEINGAGFSRQLAFVPALRYALATSGNCAVRCCRAAFTNPANSGCPSRGDEVNSGWNCVATNHG